MKSPYHILDKCIIITLDKLFITWKMAYSFSNHRKCNDYIEDTDQTLFYWMLLTKLRNIRFRCTFWWSRQT